MITQSPTLAGWLKSILIFSLMAMMTLGGTETAVAVPGVAQAQIGGPQYHDYGLAALGHNDNISLAFLVKAVGKTTR
jgi:hypothetical protein